MFVSIISSLSLSTTQSNSLLLYRALPAALLIHLVLLALIPPLASAPAARSIEFLAFVRSIPIRIERPQQRPAKPAAIVRRPELAIKTPRIVEHPVKSAVTRAPDAKAVATVSHAAVSGTAPLTVSATPAPSVAPQTTQSALPAKAVSNGYMPLGADEPIPVLDPAVRSALFALGVHVTLTIDVDANGHTKRIAFAPALDADTEQRIRDLLTSATWDPAVCGGGESCEGQAVIRL
jgi:hypothetical protein